MARKTAFILSLGLLVCLGGNARADYPTHLSAEGKVEIVRHPPPQSFGRGSLDTIPKYNPKEAENPFQVDLRGYDLSKASLKGHEADLLNSLFDSKTRWPKEVASLSVFKPDEIMELGKNPGLGVRALHKLRITGKGISIAIIDQTLLVDHAEYKNRVRMYEEIHASDEETSIHGAAVASIAVGRTVGVAPEADLYYIGLNHSTSENDADLAYYGKAIDRILEINELLPKGKPIRAISISVGWDPQCKGMKEFTDAISRAKAAGMFVVTCSLGKDYPGAKLFLSGMGRNPTKDPDSLSSYGPGIFWARHFYSEGYAEHFKQMAPNGMLLLPMDARCTASPTGIEDYVFYGTGGLSWASPYLAGLYALACQVKPEVTPDEFLSAALETGDTIQLPKDGKDYPFGKIVDPARLVGRLKTAQPQRSPR